MDIKELIRKIETLEINEYPSEVDVLSIITVDSTKIKMTWRYKTVSKKNEVNTFII